jgi:hypothetical protein
MILNKIQEILARFGGDVWISKKIFALWPYPATLWGKEETKITGTDYRVFSVLLQVGDLLLTTQKRYKWSSSSIKSSFSHLMVYTGPVKGSYDKEEKRIIKPRSLGIDYKNGAHGFEKDEFYRTITHATSDGIHTYDLLDIWNHYDHIAVVRPATTKVQQQTIVDAALSQVGKDYNFDFESAGNKALYCTELGSYCLLQAGIQPPEQGLQATKFWKPWQKNKVYLSDYFISTYPVVCTTASCNDPKLTKSSPVREMIRVKLLNAPDYTSV